MMNRQKRLISRNGNRRHLSGRTNLIGVITLLAVLTGILLYFTNEHQNEQVLNSYCSDFGFYGKSLTLMKDGNFRFSYYGCSQSSGHVRGKWHLNVNTLEFYTTGPDELLDSKYHKVENQLIAVNKQDEKFVLCEDYVDPLGRLIEEGNADTELNSD